jgi:hypothetical protein
MPPSIGKPCRLNRCFTGNPFVGHVQPSGEESPSPPFSMPPSTELQHYGRLRSSPSLTPNVVELRNFPSAYVVTPANPGSESGAGAGVQKILKIPDSCPCSSQGQAFRRNDGNGSCFRGRRFISTALSLTPPARGDSKPPASMGGGRSRVILFSINAPH